MSILRVLLIAISLFCCGGSLFAADLVLPKPAEDISAEIVKCDANSCQISERLICSMAGLPGCLVDLSSGDGQRLVRQVDSFRKPGAHLQPSGELKVMYHSWLDQTQAKSASILGFIKGSMDKNDRLEVKSTMLPGVSVLPEDLDYEKIAAVFGTMTREEIDKYGIVMGVIIYEVSGAIYSTSNRRGDIDWPCYSTMGGKSLLYKSGEENSQCFLMVVYAPVPFCLALDTLSKTPPEKSTPGHATASALGLPEDAPEVGLSRVTQSGPIISKLLQAYVGSHKPTVGVSDPPRAVAAPEVK